MAFLIDRGIAAESEDEFDAEADRYEELKSKLLGGQTMKHEETEELLAAAKSRGDQKTVDALANAAGDPAADVAEKKILRETDTGKTPGRQLLDALNALDNGEMSTSQVFMSHPSSPRRAVNFVVDSFDEGVLAIKWNERGMQPLAVKDFLEQLREAGVKKISEIARIIDAAGDLEISEVGMPNSMRNICLSMKKIADQTDYKSKFGDLLSEDGKKEPTKAELLDKLIKMCEPGSGVRNALEEIKDKFALDESNTYVQDDNDLEAADDELWDAIDRLVERKDLTADECEWDAHANVLILTYKGIGWYEGHAASASGPAEPGGFAEEVEDDVESDLTKVHDEFLRSSGFDFEFTRDSVKAAIADAAELVRKDGEEAISRKENRFGDWDYTAECVVRIPCRLTYGSADVLSEDDEIEEKEELLPDCVVNEAVETLRRMY